MKSILFIYLLKIYKKTLNQVESSPFKFRGVDPLYCYKYE